jgi:hypothetical protein
LSGGYDELSFDEATGSTGIIVKLHQVPFKVKCFRLVASDGQIKWIITKDLNQQVNCFLLNGRTTIGGRLRTFIGALSNELAHRNVRL